MKIVQNPTRKHKTKPWWSQWERSSTKTPNSAWRSWFDRRRKTDSCPDAASIFSSPLISHCSFRSTNRQRYSHCVSHPFWSSDGVEWALKFLLLKNWSFYGVHVDSIGVFHEIFVPVAVRRPRGNHRLIYPPKKLILRGDRPQKFCKKWKSTDIFKNNIVISTWKARIRAN